MKKPPSDSDLRWEKMLRLARADVGPPTRVSPLLWVVRETPVAPREEWIAEFAVFFGSTRVVSACVAGAGVFASLTIWEVWDYSQSLAWAQLIVATAGGAP